MTTTKGEKEAEKYLVGHNWAGTSEPIQDAFKAGYSQGRKDALREVLERLTKDGRNQFMLWQIEEIIKELSK